MSVRVNPSVPDRVQQLVTPFSLFGNARCGQQKGQQSTRKALSGWQNRQLNYHFSGKRSTFAGCLLNYENEVIKKG